MPEAGDTIKVEKSEAYDIFTKEATTTTEKRLYANLTECGPRNPINMKQNDGYESVIIDANKSSTDPAEFDPCNTFEPKRNEGYATSITTEKNEAYKPVGSVSGVREEYDYI